jgi:hypothetical protein
MKLIGKAILEQMRKNKEKKTTFEAIKLKL